MNDRHDTYSNLHHSMRCADGNFFFSIPKQVFHRYLCCGYDSDSMILNIVRLLTTYIFFNFKCIIPVKFVVVHSILKLYGVSCQKKSHFIICVQNENESFAKIKRRRSARSNGFWKIYAFYLFRGLMYGYIDVRVFEWISIF